MNKKPWIQVLLVHHAHKTGQTEWTVREIREKTKHSVSQKQIRRGLKELEALGLIEHQKHAKTYYFKPDA
jgi:DNA-binding HxlR family transcriptional regulator